MIVLQVTAASRAAPPALAVTQNHRPRGILTRNFNRLILLKASPRHPIPESPIPKVVRSRKQGVSSESTPRDRQRAGPLKR